MQCGAGRKALRPLRDVQLERILSVFGVVRRLGALDCYAENFSPEGGPSTSVIGNMPSQESGLGPALVFT